MIGDAAVEVGPALFFSLLIITLSFVPVFALEAQEGRLFSPLAYTKTYAMAAAAGLVGDAGAGADGLSHPRPHSRGAPQPAQPLADRGLPAAARARCCAAPKATLAVARCSCSSRPACPLSRLGGEFMPPLDEGDLLYMPSALPGISAGKAAELLQQTDRLIATVPEVQARVRQGRARRDRDRPGAARDGRDDGPAQAARRVARPA